MIEMEDSPREKKRLKEEFKDYMQTKRPVLEEVDTSEDERSEPIEKHKKDEEVVVATDDDSLALDTSAFSVIQQVDEGWFSDHVNTGSERDDFSEVDDEFRDDPSFLSDRSRNTNEIIASDSVFDDEQDGAPSAGQTSTSVVPKKSLKTILSGPRQFTSVSNVLSKPVQKGFTKSKPVVPSSKIPSNIPKDTQEISSRKRKKMQYLTSLALQNKEDSSPPRSAPTDQLSNLEEFRQTRSSAIKLKKDGEQDILGGEVSPSLAPRVPVAKMLRQKIVASDPEDSEDDGQNLYEQTNTKTKKRSFKKSKQ